MSALGIEHSRSNQIEGGTGVCYALSDVLIRGGEELGLVDLARNHKTLTFKRLGRKNVRIQGYPGLHSEC